MAEPLAFGEAASAGQWEEARRLAHRVFADEIGLKPQQPDGRLADARLERSILLVATADRRVIGMVCVGDERPFSLDEKLPGVDGYLPPHEHAYEVRLLAVEPAWRRGRVLAGLALLALHTVLERGGDLACCSALADRLPLYRRLGYEPFGPLVGTAEFPLQPMFARLEPVPPLLARLRQRAERSANRAAAGIIGA